MTSKSTGIERWADSEGFGPTVEFKGTQTAVGGRRAAPQAGLYLLYFSDGSFYVGESVNLRSRMGDHKVKWGPEIDGVRILRYAASKQKLREIEEGYIKKVAKLGNNRSRNISKNAVSWNKNALADLVDVATQELWLKDPVGFNAGSRTDLKAIPSNQFVQQKNAARSFDALPYADSLVTILRDYLEHCVPCPTTTEFHSWSVSSGTLNGRRAFCVSVGKMETFVVFNDGNTFSGFINVRGSVLAPRRLGLLRLWRRWPQVQVQRTVYDDSGDDCLMLRAKGPEGLQALLADDKVCAAAAQLVVDVMRKHPCAYTRYHCPQLVERVYPSLQRDVAALGDISSPDDDGDVSA